MSTAKSLRGVCPDSVQFSSSWSPRAPRPGRFSPPISFSAEALRRAKSISRPRRSDERRATETWDRRGPAITEPRECERLRQKPQPNQLRRDHCPFRTRAPVLKYGHGSAGSARGWPPRCGPFNP